MPAFLPTFLALCLQTAPAVQTAAVALPRAHAHNDYLHRRPLLDALDHGFCSVEADIHLVDGELLVAHDRVAVNGERSLTRLYLDPLRALIRANGGQVYRDGPRPFILLIDVKSNKKRTWPALRGLLARYADILTRWEDGRETPGPVTAILSGGVPRQMLADEKLRHCALDSGYGKISASLSPLCSRNWRSEFEWNGSGEFPAKQRALLHRRVRDVHAQGRKLRYWGVANRHEIWRELWAAGVDLIHTDNLRGLRSFLLEKRRPPRPWQRMLLQLPPGVTAWSLATDAPLRAWLVIADLSRPTLSCRPIASTTDARKETLSQLATKAGAIAAVNAHYFWIKEPVCRVRGWFLHDGKPVSPPKSRAFGKSLTFPVAGASIWWRPRGTLDIGWVYPKDGAVLDLDVPFANTPDRPAPLEIVSSRPLDRLQHAIGAGPMLLRGARPRVTRHEERMFVAADTRHPRTAVGLAGPRLFLMVVDGRSAHSRGVTLQKLAQMMRDAGASEALNLDGGGSSTLVIGEELINRPAGRARQRAVPTGIGVFNERRR